MRLGENDDIEVVIEEIGTYLRRQRNALLDCRELHLRDQLKIESVDDYVATLVLLNNRGDYDDGQLVCPGCHLPCHHGATYRDRRTHDRLALICGIWDKEHSCRDSYYRTLITSTALLLARPAASAGAGAVSRDRPGEICPRQLLSCKPLKSAHSPSNSLIFARPACRLFFPLGQ